MVTFFSVILVSLMCIFFGGMLLDYINDRRRERIINRLLEVRISRWIKSVNEGTFRFHPRMWAANFSDRKHAPVVQFYLDEELDERTHQLSLRMVLRCTHLAPTQFDFHSVAFQVGDKYYRMPFDVSVTSSSGDVPFNYAEVRGDVAETLVREIVRDVRKVVRVMVIGADFKRTLTLTDKEKEAINDLYEFYQLSNSNM